MAVRYPKVGDLLEYTCRYDKKKYIGILNESFHLGGDSYTSFRVIWNDSDRPTSYNEHTGFYSVNMLNLRSEFKFYRDGVLQ